LRRVDAGEDQLLEELVVAAGLEGEGVEDVELAAPLFAADGDSALVSDEDFFSAGVDSAAELPLPLDA